MEFKLKEIAMIAGVAALGYYVYTKMKKSTTGAVKDKVSTNKVKPNAVNPNPAAALYPAGYAENDYVRNPSGDGTVYMLKRGQKLPITLAWWQANAGLDWGSVKDMGAGLLMDIPTGNTLDA
jgi:hypothetical protein